MTAIETTDAGGASAGGASATAGEVLEALHRLPASDPPETWWRAFTAAEWPALFRLLAVAADLPRLAASSSLADLEPGLWPELSQVAADLLRLQALADRPVVPPGARPAPVYRLADLDAAAAELAEARCVTVDFLFDATRQRALDAVVGELADEKTGRWGQLERGAAPALFELFDAALGSGRFRRLTGFDLARDEYTLTLSLQNLDAAGIGWHRDLYWPREWVGEDVFAVLYGLGDDSPEKGGAFLYHVPAENDLFAVYRRRHQATVEWNGRVNDERPLHAVSRYLGEDTSRHLVILQCLRREDARTDG